MRPLISECEKELLPRLRETEYWHVADRMAYIKLDESGEHSRTWYVLESDGGEAFYAMIDNGDDIPEFHMFTVIGDSSNEKAEEQVADGTVTRDHTFKPMLLIDIPLYAKRTSPW